MTEPVNISSFLQEYREKLATSEVAYGRRWAIAHIRAHVPEPEPEMPPKRLHVAERIAELAIVGLIVSLLLWVWRMTN